MSAFVFLKSVRDLFKKCFLLVAAVVFGSFAARREALVVNQSSRIAGLMFNDRRKGGPAERFEAHTAATDT